MFLAACLALMVWSATGLTIVLRDQPPAVIARTLTTLGATLAALTACTLPYLLR